MSVDEIRALRSVNEREAIRALLWSEFEVTPRAEVLDGCRRARTTSTKRSTVAAQAVALRHSPEPSPVFFSQFQVSPK